MDYLCILRPTCEEGLFCEEGSKQHGAQDLHRAIASVTSAQVVSVNIPIMPRYISFEIYVSAYLLEVCFALLDVRSNIAYQW